MQNGSDEFFERLRQLLEARGVSEERIREFLDELRALLGGSGTSGKDLEDLANLAGRLGRATATGAAGGDAELIRELVRIFGPTLAGVVERLVDDLLDPEQGFITRPDPGEPNSVEKIAENGPGLQETFTPRCNLNNGSLQLECDGPNKVRLTFSVQVDVREEPVRYVRAKLLDLEGTPVEGERSLQAGKDPGVPEVDTEGNEKENGDSFDTEFVLVIPCSQLYRNVGTLILRVEAEDVDGNRYIHHTVVDLSEVLFDDRFECCSRFRQDDLLDEFLDQLKGGINSPDREKFKEMLKEYFFEREHAETSFRVEETDAIGSQVVLPIITDMLADRINDRIRIDVSEPDVLSG